MKRLLIVLLLIPSLASAFQEFYVQANGSFLNSGQDTNSSPKYTSTAGNGTWVGASTRTYTPADGSNPSASGVIVGDYASVYPHGATSTTYIAQVTNVATGVNGTITLSGTAFCGASPGNSSTMDINIGGAQKIPTTGSLGPFFVLAQVNQLANTGTFGTSIPVRINCKNDAVYTVTSLTNAGTNTSGQYLTYQGYTTTPGDGGRAVVDGGTSGTSYVLWNVPNNLTILIDWEFRHNGATGGPVSGLAVFQDTIVRRVVVHDVTGTCFDNQGANSLFLEDEAYNCNSANSTVNGGFKHITSFSYFIRCISHNNNGYGFRILNGDLMLNSIAHSNTGAGIEGFWNAPNPTFVLNCDSYNNGSGLKGGPSAGAVPPYVLIDNTNFVKNTGWGIDLVGTSPNTIFVGSTDNNGFGSGTMANGSGNTTNMSYVGINQGTNAVTVNYPANQTPWFAPNTGDFRINNPAANFAGFAYFFETAPSYSGSLGFPDIGAVQSKTGLNGTFSKESSGSFSR